MDVKPQLKIIPPEIIFFKEQISAAGKVSVYKYMK